jgi:predicted DNA-binding transcriptional regulator YafY
MVLTGRDPGDSNAVTTFFRDLRNLKKAGWMIESTTIGLQERYVLTVVDPRLRASFTGAERAQLLRAAQAAGLGQLYQDLDPSLEDGTPTTGFHALDLAQRAIASRCLALFGYRGRDRVVHPYDLTHKPGGWILRGREEGSEVVKSFYLERAEEFDIDRPGTAGAIPADLPPLNLDPMRRLEHDPVHVEVECPDEAVPDAVAALGANGHVERPGTGPGHTSVTVVVTNTEAFLDRLFELGTRARLVGPQSTRDAARARLSALMAGVR